MKDYYDSISEGYDELHGSEQRKKLSFVKRMISPSPDDLLLDVGCGTGLSSMFSCRVIGVDPSFGLLAQARKKGIPVVKASAESLPFRDSTFDIVISLTASQNFSDLEAGLREIRRVGKKTFAISILKRSRKEAKFRKGIRDIFGKAVFFEEEKDIIAIIVPSATIARENKTLK